MYWFNILDILEEEKKPLTAREIFHRHLETYGHASKNRIVVILKKLVVAEKIDFIEVSKKHERGRHFIYSLKK